VQYGDARTEVYFIRHAESDSLVHDDMMRPLTDKGLKDRVLVSNYLMDKGIDCIVSSPCKRAVDTLEDFAEKQHLLILPVDDFRERQVGPGWIDNFEDFAQKQWNDFGYKLCGGECLGEVQKRNIGALHRLLEDYPGKRIAVGSHGTALSTVINYYNKGFGYPEFLSIIKLMPWIVKFTFLPEKCAGIEYVDPFIHS
jgi:2,3-bisphosphoglycerate-dependent phosphoglycerate mutase